METLLVVVTVASASIALGMGGIVVKLLRDERRRSDARVEALMAQTAAGAQEPADSLADDLVLGPEWPVDTVGELFAQPDTESPWGRRLAAAAACAVVVALAGVAIMSIPSRSNPVPTRAAAAGSTSVAPIELLSLEHRAEPDGLTITGTVQNPRSGTARSGLVATALVFAQDGSLAGTGRAPLDFTRLGPGDESPFVVKVRTTGGAARYRVGFQDSQGAVIGHVDRRSAGPLARHE